MLQKAVIDFVQPASRMLHISGRRSRRQTAAFAPLRSRPLEQRTNVQALRTASIFKALHHEGSLFPQRLYSFHMYIRQKFFRRHV